MTIDKFGRHIIKHTVKRHLMEEDVMADFLGHPKVKAVLKLSTASISTPTKTVPMKYVIQICSDGSISVVGFYRRSALSKDNFLYINKFYRGKIVDVHYSNYKLAELYIDSQKFSPAQPVTLKEGTKLSLKYIGTKPNPTETEAVFAEVVIEGHAIY